MGVQATAMDQLRENLLQHRPATCRQEACASENLVASTECQDVGRVKVIELVPLHVIDAPNVPGQTPPKYPGAKAIHVLEDGGLGGSDRSGDCNDVHRTNPL
ncbi:hypothetical protein D9M72_632460 [compost metagenome]